MPETESYDVIVIGAGPAGAATAERVAGGGLTAAIIERELIGGECHYWGCIPSKTLIRPGDVLAAARRVPGVAAVVGGAVDVQAALAWRNRMTNVWDDAWILPWLESTGVTLVRGTGRLAGARIVEVTAFDGSLRRLQANEAVVVATGSATSIPPIDGLADALPWDNRAATSAKEIPGRLLVLGGGAVGCEMAQAFRRLGSEEVTLLEGADRLLAREERFAGGEVRAALEREGSTVVTGSNVVRVSREAAPGAPVTAWLESGRSYTGDEVLVAAGRHAATGGLGLETVGLESGRFVSVDDRLRAEGVDGGWLYAVGDCNGLALFTHAGKYQAKIAGDVILGKDVRDEASRDSLPRVTFTDPQVCAVGLTEEQAVERGIDVRTASFGTGDVDGAAVRGEGISGTSKLVVDAVGNVIVGATFTGPDVQELLHSATIAVVGRIPLERLRHAMPSFPTVSEVWLKLLEACGV
jgi:pyruvate/2-oxoglutarate dehydrogenase complex dihydrolipoamide dehydrogenase (E3) component